MKKIPVPFTCAIVGATGMVGQNFAKILAERKLPVKKLFLFASANSAGKIMNFRDKEIQIEALTPEALENRDIDIYLFAADSEIAQKYAPIAVKNGAVVIDNSSAWRMHPDVPLVVPEVNAADLASHNGIIANPNCCAAPAVVALKPLQQKYGLKRVVISTYQSVSGAGIGGLTDLENTAKGEPPQQFPHPIANNLIPHIDKFEPDGYTGEEKKVMAEVRKMLHQPTLPITATTVRVPVTYAHSLSINVTLENPFEISDIKQLISIAPGTKLTDDPTNNIYPMPQIAAGKDEVHIGRIRRDESYPNTLNLWVSSDNTRKGAALNAIQIVESILSTDLN